MNNGVIAKQDRVDVDVCRNANGRPQILIQFPRRFYAMPQATQGEVFTNTASIAFEKFFEHLVAMKKAGS
ncbi:MAG TPA: hypothetical protein VJO33_17120 [Gemmatimonadaceae bacterium]|nr:hypothetical protein [Gemmatimonadaceae bacterium]